MLTSLRHNELLGAASPRLYTPDASVLVPYWRMESKFSIEGLFPGTEVPNAPCTEVPHGNDAPPRRPGPARHSNPQATLVLGPMERTTTSHQSWLLAFRCSVSVATAGASLARHREHRRQEPATGLQEYMAAGAPTRARCTCTSNIVPRILVLDHPYQFYIRVPVPGTDYR